MSVREGVLDRTSFLAALEQSRQPFHDRYFAMYSSVLKGLVTDPVLMMVPVDDHLVHRGDGVFETFKCVGGNIYNMRAHLDRLVKSAAALSLALPCPVEEIESLARRTVEAGGRGDCYVRVFLSRGPGSFGVNPNDCPAPQIYVVSARLDPPFMQKHPAGARVITSAIGVKPGFLASVKTCNYLPNVLMKREAVDAGVDFVVAFDERGFMAEGATENFGIVARDGRLLFPRLDRILPGTTMLRVAELAAELVRTRELAGVEFADITAGDARGCREMLVLGTTPNVAAVVEWDGRPVGDGRPGPVQGRLDALLARDMRTNAERLTPVAL